jgi:hypothetical protein
MWMVGATALLLVWRIDFLDPFLALTSPSPGQDLRAAPDLLIDAPLQHALMWYLAWFLVILGCAFTDSSVSNSASAVGMTCEPVIPESLIISKRRVDGLAPNNNKLSAEETP